MQSEKIRILQQERNNLRYVAHKHNDHSKWNQFREKRNDVIKKYDMKKPNSIEKLYRQTSQKQCGAQSAAY